MPQILLRELLGDAQDLSAKHASHISAQSPVSGDGHAATEHNSVTSAEQYIRAQLHHGLSASAASISSKYFYDALGSKLFEAICLLPEYYPTRTEALIFEQYADDIAAIAGTGVTLIDLGAGNCAKAARLFPVLQPRQYVPIDISTDFLRTTVSDLRKKFPAIPIHEVAMDFSASLDLPETVEQKNRLFFYPGSSLGNFMPEQALQFLQRIRHALPVPATSDSGQAGGLLIGVDLVKERALLDAAYDDALGVTAAFNANILRHVNRLLGSNFSVADWQHRGFFNPDQQRIEMHLQARRAVKVSWPGGHRHFEAGEQIHTENSYKYTPDGFRAMLTRAGFGQCHMWFDPQRWFMLCYAKAV